MLADQYGLAVSTSSPAARDAYDEGLSALLTFYPGAVAGFDRAIALDPGFALAHAGRARALQLDEQPAAAKAALEQAGVLAEGISRRERSQIEVVGLLLAGRSADALEALRRHVGEWPRDAMVLAPTTSQLGLIALSGRAGREHELASFLASLAPHWGDDAWFGAHYGMALSESGQQDAARPLIEASIARNPRNAYAGHALAHLRYEDGDCDGALTFMRGWLPTYPRTGRMHGHLSWHLALAELQAGNVEEGFRLYTDAFASDTYSGPSLIKVIDAASFLWRAELAGHERDPARWETLRIFANKLFPRAGMAYLDWHMALLDAVAGDGAALDERVRTMQELTRAGRYPWGPALPALAHGFAAFARQDYAAAIDAIAPVMPERERICGSRAQIDLVEFTLIRAYVASGRLEELRAFLRTRRPGALATPIAGLEALH